MPRLSAVYRLTLTEGLEMKLSGNNLLDPEVEYTQGGEVKESYTEGREFGLSLSWRWD